MTSGVSLCLRCPSARAYDAPVQRVTHRSEGASGCWTLTESRPPDLSRWVESIWCFEGAIPQRREKHFPNGLVELVVQLDDRFRFVRRGTGELCAASCVRGMQTGPTVIEAPGKRSRVLGVRLYPGGAYAVLGTSLWELSERIVDLEALVRGSAVELAERCSDGGGAEARVGCAARWLSSRIGRSRGVDPRISWMVDQIALSDGRVSIASLRDRTGLSKKRVLEAFREQIGLAPKMYARVLRFRRALSLLHEDAASLAEVALAAGYYDQPHMNLEFRELGGLAPGEFLASTRYSPTTAVG